MRLSVLDSGHSFKHRALLGFIRMVSRKTPADVVKTLADALTKALQDPEVVAWARQADIPLPIVTPAQADRVLHEQIDFFERWKKYLKPS